MNIDSTTGERHPMGLATSDLQLYMADGSTNLHFYKSTAFDLTTGSLGTNWNLITATSENGVGTKIYVNGILIDSDGDTYSLASSNLDIGRRYGASSYFSGSISDVAIYSSALTQDEVSQLYKAGRTTAKIKVDASDLVTNGDMELDSNWNNSGLTTCEQSTDQKHSGTYSWKNIADATADFVSSDAFSLIDGHTYKLVAWIYGDGSASIRSRVRDVTNSINYGQSETTWAAAWTLHETTFTATSDTANAVYSFYFNGAGTGYIDDISVVDITNAITPKLQKGLILDMPLSEPYTEAGSDLVTNGDFSGGDTGWSSEEATLDTTGETGKVTATADDTAGIKTINTPTFIQGKKYNLKFDVLTATGGFASGNILEYSGSYEVGEWSGTGSYDITFTYRSGTNQLRWLSSASIGDILEIDNVIVKELDATTKDRTPNGNDGTVEGATIKYDGLVNAGDGIAYINQDKAYGTWEFDVNKYTTADEVRIHFISSDETPTNYYTIFFRNDFKLQLGKDGFLLFRTAAPYFANDIDYRIKVTRSLAGVFTVYIKGGSFGWDDWTTVVADSGSNPVTNNDYTTSNYLVVDLDNTDTVSNLKINGKRHSLADAVQSSGTWTTTGLAYDFDGTDDYIDLGADKPTDLTGDITISAWIYPESAGENGGGRIIDNGKFVAFTTGARTAFTGDDSTVIQSAESIVFDNWYHLLITRPSAGTNTNIYINGVLSGTANQDSGTPAGGTTNTFIGNRDAGDRTFDGQISGLKIWNRVLSTDEIGYLYNKERGAY